MIKSKVSFLVLALSIGLYSCNKDDTTALVPKEDSSPVEEMEEVTEDPAVTLANDRTEAITLMTGDSEKIWRISSAELVNANGSFDISTNFNVSDDEFVFKKSPLTTGKSSTDFEASLEWKQHSEINLSADSPEAALIESYIPAESYSVDFDADSSAKVLGNDGNFEFTIAANGGISGILQIDGVTLNVGLAEKMEAEFQAVPTAPLSFTSAFTFDSNSIAGNAPDMVGSLANNNIYISMREDALADPTTFARPERVLKYDLNTNVMDEKLFFQSDFVSKQLLVNNNKLVVVGGQKINSYDLDIVADPTTSQTYDAATGITGLAFTRYGTAVANNAIYIIGGALGNASGDRIYKFDIATEAMTEFAIMPEARSGARAEIINDKLYIFGGTETFLTPPAKNTIYIYDLNTAALTIETMPTAVNLTYVGRSNSLIYVAGTVTTKDASGATTDEEPYIGVYDTDDGTYTELQSDLSSPAQETIHAMAVFGNSIYVIYGERETVAQGTLQTWSVLTASI